jgi:hypothetical protein
MAAPEREIVGVNLRGVAGHEWDITAVDTSNDVVTIDISELNQDITQVLSSGDTIEIEDSTGNDGSYDISSVTDNGDGTADVTLSSSISDSTADGILVYRLQIPGETDAELSKNYGNIDTRDKDTGFWGDQLPGRREWDASADILHTESDGAHEAPFNDIVKLEVTVGGTTYKAKGLDELSLTFTAETDPVAGFEDPKWRFLRVAGQSMEISTSGSYFDPESDAGEFYDKLKQEAQAGNAITFTLTFAGLTFEGDLRPSDWTITAPADNSRATFDWTFTESGPTTFSGSIDTGLDLLISAWFNRDHAHLLMEQTNDDGTRRTGSTRYSGKAVIEELGFEASTDSPLTHSYSFAGDGKLDEKVQA